MTIETSTSTSLNMPVIEGAQQEALRDLSEVAREAYPDVKLPTLANTELDFGEPCRLVYTAARGKKMVTQRVVAAEYQGYVNGINNPGGLVIFRDRQADRFFSERAETLKSGRVRVLPEPDLTLVSEYRK